VYQQDVLDHHRSNRSVSKQDRQRNCLPVAYLRQARIPAHAPAYCMVTADCRYFMCRRWTSRGHRIIVSSFWVPEHSVVAPGMFIVTWCRWRRGGNLSKTNIYSKSAASGGRSRVARYVDRREDMTYRTSITTTLDHNKERRISCRYGWYHVGTYCVAPTLEQEGSTRSAHASTVAAWAAAGDRVAPLLCSALIQLRKR
jgi:hypothetical protein